MSRQFDEYMEDKFEYQGERKTLIYPTSFAELTEALGVRNTLQSIIDFATRDEDTSGYEEMKERQNEFKLNWQFRQQHSCFEHYPSCQV